MSGPPAPCRSPALHTVSGPERDERGVGVPTVTPPAGSDARTAECQVQPRVGCGSGEVSVSGQGSVSDTRMCSFPEQVSNNQGKKQTSSDSPIQLHRGKATLRAAWTVVRLEPGAVGRTHSPASEGGTDTPGTSFLQKMRPWERQNCSSQAPRALLQRKKSSRTRGASVVPGRPPHRRHFTPKWRLLGVEAC